MPDEHTGRPQPPVCWETIQFVTDTLLSGGTGSLGLPSRQSHDAPCFNRPPLPVLTDSPSDTTRSGRYIHQKPFGEWSSPQGSGTKRLAAS